MPYSAHCMSLPAIARHNCNCARSLFERFCVRIFGLLAYKIQLMQEMESDDEMATDSDLHKKILVSNKAHFSWNGYVNK